MNDVQAAWTAGLFEGEGSIEIALPPRTRTHIRLYLSMTDHDVVEKFVGIVGCGAIKDRVAPSQTRDNWKPQWAWRAGKEQDVRRLLGLWLPHFGERRSLRALEALACLDAKEDVRWRTCYCGKHFRAGRTDGQQWACSAYCRTQWQLTRLREAA
jgi:hypothetical protein